MTDWEVPWAEGAGPDCVQGGEGGEALQADRGSDGGGPHHAGQVGEDGLQGRDVSGGHQVPTLDSLGLLGPARTHGKILRDRQEEDSWCSIDIDIEDNIQLVQYWYWETKDNTN